MWCPECRQDVPGIASGATGKLCCVRCRAPLASQARPDRGDGPPSPSRPAPRAPSADADLAEQLEALERLTKWDFGEDLPQPDWTACDTANPEVELSLPRRGSVDPPHPRLRGWHQTGPNSSVSLAGYFTKHRRSLLGWSLLLSGLASFFCGAALLTWSLTGGRSDLWTIGVPITLAGQVGLLLGVVLALDRLGQQNRQTVDRLGRLDEQLDELRTAAWLNAPVNQTAGMDHPRE